MSLQVELFRSDDYVSYDEFPLQPLLRAFFEPLIGQDLAEASFRLVFLPLGDAQPLAGPPSLVNLRSSHGYVQVYILLRGRLIYRHPHPVREVVGPQLQEILIRREPDETHWGFGISGPEMDGIALIRPTPTMEHGVNVNTGGHRVPRFLLEEVAEPEPPEATLAELGADVPAGDPGALPGTPVSLVVTDPVRRAFASPALFSTQIEEGGFLAGRVFRAPGGHDSYIVEVTAAIRAQRTGASMLHFTFTGESFLRVSEQIAARQADEQLVGWYHTHLFPASDALGLSSVDVDLHRTTFRRPWQVAALINLTDDARVLRFYRAEGQTMALAPYWVARP
jgi:proteasome lid subunit RPN8/RPN11